MPRAPRNGKRRRGQRKPQELTGTQYAQRRRLEALHPGTDWEWVGGKWRQIVYPTPAGLAEGRGWTRPAPVDWRDEVRGTGPTPEALGDLRRQQERRRNGM